MEMKIYWEVKRGEEDHIRGRQRRNEKEKKSMEEEKEIRGRMKKQEEMRKRRKKWKIVRATETEE